ncbi:MAG: HEPN domain-containing protein [Candidatus Methanoperedens sp.]|nr:HEPN domain-containing protein [Candidatus Methanoperedens sp.]
MFESTKIAKAFIAESKIDLISAQLLFDKGIYSRAVYFAQQSSEKAIKSCLALRNIISGEHRVTAFFEEEFRKDFDKKIFDEILKNARELEVLGVKTRYPLFSRPDKPLWIPSEEYTEEDAREAIIKY